MEDPDFYDAKVAGWWVWGLSAWLGHGWCPADGANGDGKLPHLGPERGVLRASLHHRLPHLSDAGTGVHRVSLSRQIPHLGAERGVLRPSLADAVDGVEPWAATARWRVALTEYMRRLCDRLRRVRVACGDWKRVVRSDSVLHSFGAPVGVFLDPPYSLDERDPGVYTFDSDISAEVRAWALAHGDDPRFRIALCGYDGEHQMPSSWTVVRWTARGGFGGLRRDGVNLNRFRETIWFSPHCLVPEATGTQLRLWEEDEQVEQVEQGE
jgi:hypothetical protein